MNQIALDLGIIKIYWYSIMISIGMLLGSYIFYKRSKVLNINKDTLFDILFYTIIFGIIGARFYYVIFNLDYYIKYPIEIFEIWNGGLAIHGAIIGGILSIYYFSKKYKFNFFKFTDIVVPSLMIAQAVGRWGNFFNMEAHGPATTLHTLKNLGIPNFIINGMKINGVYYHPTFLYESIWNGLGLIVLFIIIKKIKPKTRVVTGFYFVWYSVGRFLIESLRTDSLMLGPIKMAQFISIILIIIGLCLIFYRQKNTRVNINKERIDNYE